MSGSHHIFRGILHTFLGSYFGKAVNFVATILLTRLLLPEDFGIVALAMFFVSTAGLIKEFGFDYALIHRQEGLDEASVTHFYLNIILSLAALVITAVLIFFLSGHYDNRVLMATIALAAIFLVRSLATTSRVMLEKDLRFSLLAWIDTTSNILTLASAVALAYLGLGFWSLVIAGSVNSLVYVLVTAARYWRHHPVSFRGRSMDKEAVKWFFSYGKWMILGAAGTIVVLQYDSFIAGTLLGISTLGFYERAYRFSQYPTDSITHVVSRIALSIYAKYQDDKVQLSYYFSLFLSMIVRIAFPLCAIIFIFADEIVLLLFGDKWASMVTPLRWLLIYSLLRPIYDDTGAFFSAIGKPKILSTILIIMAGFMFVLVPLLTWSWGIKGTAIAADTAMLVGVVLSYWKLSEYIQIPYLKIFVLPSLCVIIAYFGSYLSLEYLVASQKDVVRLGAGVSIFVCCYTAILLSVEWKQLAVFLKFVTGKGAVNEQE